MNTEYSQTSLASDEIGTDVKQQIAEKRNNDGSIAGFQSLWLLLY